MSRIGMDSRPVTKLGFLRNWAQARLGSIRHERRVSQIAAALVDATSSLHDLTPIQRRQLKLSALVHDIGRCIDDDEHPAVGAEMLLGEDALPLKRRERRALAFLTLYHRGEVPCQGKEKILRDSDDRQGLRTVLAFLRAADSLDSRSLPSPRLAVSYRAGRLRIRLRLREDSDKARRVFTRRKKFRMLEETLGCKVEVSIEAARSRLRLVA